MNPKFEVISAWTYKRYFLGFNVIETSPEVKREDVIRHINLTDGDGNWDKSSLVQSEVKKKKSKINLTELKK